MTESNAKLLWKCRRGMLELDLWLMHYLKTDYPKADSKTQAAFHQLLEENDTDLLEWFLGTQAPPVAHQAMVRLIQQSNQMPVDS